MERCIFCKSTSGPFRTREHIFPESLGGGEWAILPRGLMCDSCQNAFGSAIEQQALGDYPFNFIRTFLGIPTKKRKAPWFNSWEGVIVGGEVPGQFGYVPSPLFAEATANETKTVMRLLAEPRRADMVCRTLLKMGLEVIAADDPTDAFAERFDCARRYALQGVKDGDWWYLQLEDHDLADRLFRGEPVDCELVKLELFEIEDGDDSAEMFHLKLFFVDMIVPMENRVLADPRISDDPEMRVFTV